MDKETLSNYGWIVICVLVLAVMLALATPFGTFVADAIKSTTQGLFDVNQNALNSTGLINIGDQSFGEGGSGEQGGTGGAGDQGGAGNQGGTGLPAVGTSAEDCTWDEIKAISEAGKGDEYFNLGDTKTFTTTDGKTIVMEIVAFNADTKSDGSGTAGITWISRDIVANHEMNSSATNTNGWAASSLRAWLQSDFYATLPEEVKNKIVSVNKSYYDATTNSTLSCVDNVWIPSNYEMANGRHSWHDFEGYGVSYTEYFSVDSACIKYPIGSGTGGTYWLRSAKNNSEYFQYIVYTQGQSTVGFPATSTMGVVLGFCT